MQWTISNIVGATGWFAGLSCLKGGLSLPAKVVLFSGQGQMAAGALLCAGSAGVLLWANIGAQ